jgi:hypothetical protein
MKVSGYKLERVEDGAEISRWTTIPGRVDLPGGDAVFSADETFDNGQFRIVATSWEVPDPIPERALIRKSVILDRLTDAQLASALSLMTARQKERWRMPGRPDIYVDDPELLNVLSAIKADADLILKSGD